MIYDLITRCVAGIIGVYDPVKAVRYVNKRDFLKRGYAAAKLSGSDQLWRPALTSGLNENVKDWANVTAKARDLARNNPHIAGARRRFRSAIVSQGIWPRPKILKRGATNKFDYDTKLVQDILARWEMWAPVAGVTGESLYQCQRIAANHVFDDGQVLIRRVWLKEFPYMTIEVLECDHLATIKDTYGRSADGTRIVNGIHLDGYNKPIGYWLTPGHPSEEITTPEYVPASDIIHLFDRQRASEVTGISGYASVVQNFYRINEYSYSTMDTARMVNHYGVWVESPYVDEYGSYITNPDGGQSVDADTASSRYKHVSPAAIHYGLPGEKPHVLNPNNPGSQYDPFMTRELQSASVGAGISYEAISHDGSRTNFAGSRQLQLLERAYTRMFQAIFEEKLHTQIYKWFIEAEMSFGKPRLIMPNFENEKARYLRVKFNKPVQEWVDPLKDMKARELAIKLNISTETDEAEDIGRDIEEVLATKAYEKEIKERLGLIAVPEPEPEPDDDEDEENDLSKPEEGTNNAESGTE